MIGKPKELKGLKNYNKGYEMGEKNKFIVGDGPYSRSFPANIREHVRTVI